MATASFILSLKDLLSGPLAKATASTKSLAQSMLGAAATTNRVEDGFSKLNSTLRTGAGLMGGYFAASAIKSSGMDAINAAADFQAMSNSIRFASGTAVEGEKNLAFIADTAKKLGLDITAAQMGFKTFSGAVMGTTLQGEKAREIFTSVAKASTVMGLSASDQEGVFLALGQIISKGKVQAEELRGQLGERLPGAFQIAARSMGVTTAQLDKMLETGKVTAEQFLPRFAVELEKTFGAGVPQASEGLRAQMNRFSNFMLEFKTQIGFALAPVATQFFSGISSGLSELQPQVVGLVKEFAGMTVVFMKEMKPAIGAFVQDLASAAKWLKENASAVLSVTKTVLGAVVAFKAFSLLIATIKTGMALYTAATAIATVATTGMATSVTILGVAFTLTPIGLIVAGVAALTAGVIYAWHNFDGFRHTIIGVWEVMKELWPVIEGMGKALIGYWTFNPAMIKEGIAGAMDAIKSMDLSEAFNKPFKEAAQGAAKIASDEMSYKGIGEAYKVYESNNSPSNNTSLPTALKPSTVAMGGATTVAESKARSVSLTIDKVEINVSLPDAGEMSMNKLGEQIARVFIDAARDTELVLSNG